MPPREHSPSAFSRRNRRLVLATLTAALLTCAAPQAQETTIFDLDKATIDDIHAAFKAEALTAERLVQLYLNRIATYDDHGPALNAIITINPDALEQARALDAELAEGELKGPLHGIPVLLKDNYNTADMPTTGGSVALAGSIPHEDAHTVARLRDMGAIILGKANLSEFATPAGRGAYSSMNDVTKNPHRLESDPAGSSGGSGAAAAANFATLAFGTDTGGSIRGPAAANGVVGVRPTYGLVSRAGIIPQALTMDTAGPLARNVTDAAIALGVFAGTDPADPTTVESDSLKQADYTAMLNKDALDGARIGVVRNYFGGDPEVDALIDAAVADIVKLGAEVVELNFKDEFVSSLAPLRAAINAEFEPDLEEYLAKLDEGYPKSLEEVVRISVSPEVLNSPRPVNPGLIETHLQNLLIGGKDNPDYIEALAAVSEVKVTVAAFMDEHEVDALVWPTSRCTAEPIYSLPDPDRVCTSGPGASLVATYSGFPDVQVPAGYTSRGLPTTISFLGRPYSEAQLLGYAFAYEQATLHRKVPELFPELPGEAFEY
ncbi:amidase family protein [Devosia sp. 919]|uniref:amidase family protein n=1 Tax=Devosia sp. 919 TaxID=2726065 RepID=UPI0015575479|nr:amidase family protein [Devosia sp. 919]